MRMRSRSRGKEKRARVREECWMVSMIPKGARRSLKIQCRDARTLAGWVQRGEEMECIDLRHTVRL